MPADTSESTAGLETTGLDLQPGPHLLEGGTRAGRPAGRAATRPAGRGRARPGRPGSRRARGGSPGWPPDRGCRCTSPSEVRGSGRPRSSAGSEVRIDLRSSISGRVQLSRNATKAMGTADQKDGLDGVGDAADDPGLHRGGEMVDHRRIVGVDGRTRRAPCSGAGRPARC